MAGLTAAAALLACSARAQLGGMQMPMGGGGGGAQTTNSLLNDLRAIQFPPGGAAQQPGGQQAGAFGGFQQPGAMPQGLPPQGGGLPQQQGGVMQEEVPEDLECNKGPRAAAWVSVKNRFRGLFGADHMKPYVLATKEEMAAALEGALADLKAVGGLNPEAADECGLGKLNLQLLSFAAIEEPMALVQLFQGYEQLASPVLTMILDVPWVVIAQSGWPVFGLLGQICLRKHHVAGALNTEDVDGLNDPASRKLQAELMAAIQGGNAAAQSQAGLTFLQNDGANRGSAFPPLTALATQAVGASDMQERGSVLVALQQGVKQVVGSGAELDVMLSTQWPLWGLIHHGVSGFRM